MTEKCAIPQRVLDLKIADAVDDYFTAIQSSGHGTYGRMLNFFRYQNPRIETVGDLVKLSNRELAHTPNIGKRTIAQIEAVLNRLLINLPYWPGETPTYLGAVELPEPPNPFYSLKLHEVLEVNKNTQVMRVPGGWIYEFLAEESQIFVPEHGGTPCA